MSKRTVKGAPAFLEYYRSIFGDETDVVLEGLLREIPPILRFSAARADELRALWQKEGLTFETLEHYPLAAKWPKEVPFGEKLPGYSEQLFYPMSESSLLPVLALDVQKDDVVLDACAAPGGKALMIAETLSGSGTLVANDLSAGRANRLRQVLADYPVTVTVKPAEALPYLYPEYFDKILVDAPCSSEQHVYQSPVHLAAWSHKRVTTLKKRQYGLIKSLLYALKPGGRLVYSTCAITPEENEEVIEKVLKKQAEVVTLAQPLKRVMPHSDNLDPMFVAVLHKPLR
jgi:5-methylcytosine rRNA methyltransferase NSUN4